MVADHHVRRVEKSERKRARESVTERGGGGEKKSQYFGQEDGRLAESHSPGNLETESGKVFYRK